MARSQSSWRSLLQRPFYQSAALALLRKDTFVPRVEEPVRQFLRRNWDEEQRMRQRDEVSEQRAFEASWRGRLGRVNRLVVCGCLAILAGLVLWGGLLTKEGARLPAMTAPRVDGSASPVELPWRDRFDASAAMLERYLRAPEWQDLMPLVRHSERMPGILRAYYETHRHRAVTHIEWVDAHQRMAHGARFFLHEVRLDHGTETQFIAVAETEEGYRVDWETAIGYQSAPWTDFVSNRLLGPHTFRVLASVDDYANFQFASTTEWACYRLRAPHAERSVYGYARRGSPLHQQLMVALDSKAVAFVMLEVAYPRNGNADDQVTIRRLVQPNWISPQPLQRHPQAIAYSTMSWMGKP